MSLISFIEEAFSKRVAPPDVVEVGAPSTDIYDDARALRGKDWRDLTCSEWERYPSAVYGFSARAFCYFLPGIYSAGVRENRPDLLVNSSLVMTLDRGNSPGSWDDFFVARWAALSEIECEATQRWLLWLADFAESSIPESSLSRAFDTMYLLSNRDQATPLAGRSKLNKP